ncbi:ankyrin repeat domain-containing protein [Sulfurimonas sp.]|uniref:ankyrin repeat domain-containing protein n=1 Tax=Sulfurimonas sp. TaxID=2022749 RepID=UPI002B47E988|nr:ankyrin repeat domain-containing protein [Sulfurimonas sp.]
MNITKEEEQRYLELQLTALDFAREGKTKELSSMIKHGMSVNLCTHKDDSLLMLATYNGNFETSKMLLSYDVDINKINLRGQTPLEGVCFKGNIDIVKLLVENGANSDGKAIIYATIFGNKDIVEYLKKHGSKSLKNNILGIKIELIALMIFKLKKLFFK